MRGEDRIAVRVEIELLPPHLKPCDCEALSLTLDWLASPRLSVGSTASSGETAASCQLGRRAQARPQSQEVEAVKLLRLRALRCIRVRCKPRSGPSLEGSCAGP